MGSRAYVYLLPRQSVMIERLNMEFCNLIRKKYPKDEESIRRMSIIENGKVRMAHLAVYRIAFCQWGSCTAHRNFEKFGLQRFLRDISRRFINITNGVTQRRWLLECNPDLAKFITKRIGDGWITDFPQIKKLADFAGDPLSQEEFLAIKKRNNIRLVEYLNQSNKLHDAYGKPLTPTPIIDPDSLFDVQIKRIHEYKRQLMNACTSSCFIRKCSTIRDHRALNARASLAERPPPAMTQPRISSASLMLWRAKSIKTLLVKGKAQGSLYGELQCHPCRNDHTCRRSVRADFYRRHRGLRHRQHEAVHKWRSDYRDR